MGTEISTVLLQKRKVRTLVCVDDERLDRKERRLDEGGEMLAFGETNFGLLGSF